MRKDFCTASHIKYTCITVILSLSLEERMLVQFELQNAYIINVTGCVEILPTVISIVLIHSKITPILLVCNGTEDDRLSRNMFSNPPLTERIVLFALKIDVS